MKHLVLIFGCFVIGCSPETEKASHPENASNGRPPRLTAPAAPEPDPPTKLLETPNISISSDGKSFSYRLINNASEAEVVLDEIRALPPSAGRDNAIESIIGRLAKVDPRAARQALEQWDDALIGQWLDAAKDLVRKLAETDPEAAASFIEESVPAPSQPEVWAQFLVTLSPIERIPFLDRIPEGTMKTRIGADILHVWLSEDPEACALWLDEFVQSLHADDLHELSRSVHNSFTPAPETADRLAATRAATNPVAREVLANQLWARADPTERATLFPEISEILPDLADRARESTIRSAPAAFADGLSAAEARSLSASDMRLLIDSWSDKHPRMALDWAMSRDLPGAAHALHDLYRLEPEEALAVASKLPPGKERDNALGSVTSMAAWDGRVEAARELLPLIGDPGKREAATKNVEQNSKRDDR